MVKGIAASKGIAMAKVYRLETTEFKIIKKTNVDVEAEMARFTKAITDTKDDLVKLRDHTEKTMGIDKAKIFEAHMLMADDPEILSQVTAIVNEKRVNVEVALREVRDQFIAIFEAMDNEYMKERASDIKDVTNRMFGKLLNIRMNDLSLIDEEVILVAHDLTPSDTAQINKTFVKGFVTNVGGRTSHSAIMARNLEIPAIVGTKTILNQVKDGDLIILDGLTGEVIINPAEEVLKSYHDKQVTFQKSQKELEAMKNEKTISKDGVHVELAANIGTPEDLHLVLNNGAEGIGLFRTEFLYMGKNSFPTEDEQFEAYKLVLEEMKGKPVVIRTLDIGGDKELPYLEMPDEMNPFLGYRAIRLCLDRKDIFKTQCRSLLRASSYGNLRIMFPMIATLEEFNEAKAFLMDVKAELLNEGVSVSDEIQVGMMIEIPSAALLAHQFAKVVDFFSIGTNDLIQYTFAADRMNERVSYLYQPYHPALLSLIKMVIDAAHQVNKWVGMCGEMAGDEIAVPLLLGLGLDEFSMSASSIPSTRQLIKTLSRMDMETLASEALNEATNDGVISLVKKYLNN